MKKKNWVKVFCIVLLFIGFLSNIALATDMDTLIDGMKGISDVSGAEGSQVRYVLNAVIKIIQIAGSGIALIVVTMLGVKYMLASPGEKADYKKTAVPIVIGCVLLFAGVNIAGMIADIGAGFNK